MNQERPQHNRQVGGQSQTPRLGGPSLLATLIFAMVQVPSAHAMGIDPASKTPSGSAVNTYQQKRAGTTDSTFDSYGAGAVQIAIPPAAPVTPVNSGSGLTGVSFWTDEFRFNNKNSPELLTKTAADYIYSQNSAGSNGKFVPLKIGNQSFDRAYCQYNFNSGQTSCSPLGATQNLNIYSSAGGNGANTGSTGLSAQETYFDQANNCTVSVGEVGRVTSGQISSGGQLYVEYGVPCSGGGSTNITVGEAKSPISGLTVTLLEGGRIQIDSSTGQYVHNLKHTKAEAPLVVSHNNTFYKMKVIPVFDTNLGGLTVDWFVDVEGTASNSASRSVLLQNAKFFNSNFPGNSTVFASYPFVSSFPSTSDHPAHRLSSTAALSLPPNSNHYREFLDLVAFGDTAGYSFYGSLPGIEKTRYTNGYVKSKGYSVVDVGDPQYVLLKPTLVKVDGARTSSTEVVQTQNGPGFEYSFVKLYSGAYKLENSFLSWLTDMMLSYSMNPGSISQFSTLASPGGAPFTFGAEFDRFDQSISNDTYLVNSGGGTYSSMITHFSQTGVGSDLDYSVNDRFGHDGSIQGFANFSELDKHKVVSARLTKILDPYAGLSDAQVFARATKESQVFSGTCSNASGGGCSIQQGTDPDTAAAIARGAAGANQIRNASARYPRVALSSMRLPTILGCMTNTNYGVGFTFQPGFVFPYNGAFSFESQSSFFKKSGAVHVTSQSELDQVSAIYNVTSDVSNESAEHFVLKDVGASSIGSFSIHEMLSVTSGPRHLVKSVQSRSTGNHVAPFVARAVGDREMMAVYNDHQALAELFSSRVSGMTVRVSRDLIPDLDALYQLWSTEALGEKPITEQALLANLFDKSCFTASGFDDFLADFNAN